MTTKNNNTTIIFISFSTLFSGIGEPEQHYIKY